MSRRTAPALRALPLAALLLVGTACSGGDDGDAEQPLPSLSQAVSGQPTISPGDFCDRIDERIFAETIGEVAESTSYGNGDPATLAPGVEDVAHEFSCTVTAADGATLRAWVFVPPVTPERAKALVRSAGSAKGCTTAEAAFGEPGVRTLCSDADGAATTTLQGLFTDTWFSCSASVPDLATADLGSGGLAKRTDAWCASALSAAASGDSD
ncbi:hypothetical protein GCM10009668_30110 [Nocardioides dubius]|uniref:DUF3558 domain-containing protein n=1 Tax=Nocardioides dubius TaxID=317019 RepID=A0ABN1TXX1_9ACTN